MTVHKLGVFGGLNTFLLPSYSNKHSKIYKGAVILTLYPIPKPKVKKYQDKSFYTKFQKE